MRLDIVEEWPHIFSNAGLKETQTARGPVAMMTAREFLSDEGRTLWR